ncbi:MAG: ORF6N domain-containing protein [Elusimicrobiota bacterium]
MNKHQIKLAGIEQKILIIRGHKVMLDSDLAQLYAVPTYRLNEQVKRNLKRFPADFMFQLTRQEFKNLISQFGVGSIYSVDMFAIACDRWSQANEYFCPSNKSLWT